MAALEGEAYDDQFLSLESRDLEKKASDLRLRYDASQSQPLLSATHPSSGCLEHGEHTSHALGLGTSPSLWCSVFMPPVRSAAWVLGTGM